MATKAAITKVLSCALIFVILMSLMPVSVFAVNDSNNSTGNVSNRSNELVNSFMVNNAAEVMIPLFNNNVTDNYRAWSEEDNRSGDCAPVPDADLPVIYLNDTQECVLSSDSGNDTNIIILTDVSDGTRETVSALGCEVYVKIDDPCCVGYCVYVDGVYQFTEGQDGTPDGYCAFYVSAGTHTIKINKNGRSASKTNYFQCGNTYRWVSMPHCWCENGDHGDEVKFRGIVTDKAPEGMTGGYWWDVKVDEWISGSMPCEIIRVRFLVIPDVPIGSYDLSIRIGDYVEAYGSVYPNECSVGLNGESYYIKKISSELLSINVWTDKSEYKIGETVTIYYKTNKKCTAKLTITKPDGGDVVYGPNEIPASTRSKSATAGYPTGKRTVVFEAWAGAEYKKATCYFDVVDKKEWEVKFQGTVNSTYPEETYFSCEVRVDKIISDPDDCIEEGWIVDVVLGDSPCGSYEEVKKGDKIEVFGKRLLVYSFPPQISLCGKSSYYLKKIDSKTLSISLWTDKYEYKIGETVTIYYKTNKKCTAKLTITKPDGGDVVYGPNEIPASTRSKSATAGYPTGKRTVVFEAWDGAEYKKATCYFDVVEEAKKVKIRGEILVDSPIISFYSFDVKIDEILDDPTGNLQKGEIVNVYGYRSGPAQVDDVTVGDKVEVFGEFRGYVGTYEQIYLSDGGEISSDHYVKKIDKITPGSFEIIRQGYEVGPKYKSLDCREYKDYFNISVKFHWEDSQIERIKIKAATGESIESDIFPEIGDSLSLDAQYGKITLEWVDLWWVGTSWHYVFSYVVEPKGVIEKPDLIIQDISLSPPNLEKGDTVTFTVKTKNQGSKNAEGFYVCYYIDGSYYTKNYINSLSAGSTTTTSFTWIAECGTHSIKAYADCYDAIDESNEDNNEKSIIIEVGKKPDEIKFIGTFLNQNNPMGFTMYFFKVDEVIESSMYIPVGDEIRIMVYCSAVPDPLDNYDLLDIGDRAEVYAKFPPSPIERKQYDPWIDREVWVASTAGDEKCYVKKIDLPDLVISDLSWSPAHPLRGGKVDFFVTVKNIGRLASEPCTLGFRFSGFEYFGSVVSLESEEEVTYKIPFDPEVDGEPKTSRGIVEAEIDFFFDVDENNKMNNREEKFICDYIGEIIERRNSGEDLTGKLFLVHGICFGKAPGTISQNILCGDLPGEEAYVKKNKLLPLLLVFPYRGASLEIGDDIIVGGLLYEAKVGLYKYYLFPSVFRKLPLSDNFISVKQVVEELPSGIFSTIGGPGGISIHDNTIFIKIVVGNTEGVGGQDFYYIWSKVPSDTGSIPIFGLVQVRGEIIRNSVGKIPYYIEPVENGIKKLWGEVWSREKILLYFECPVHITIVDQHSRTISDDRTNEIPDASMIITDDTKIFYLPVDLTYSVNIGAYDSGTFNFTMFSPIGKGISITKFENIPVTSSTKASVDIEPGVTDYTMSIDYDGDGSTDEERHPDVKDTIEVGQDSYPIQLHTGWNLISLPLTPEDTNVLNVLSPVAGNWNSVWSYEGGRWKRYDLTGPDFLNTLTFMEPGKGYWLHMKSDDTLFIRGSEPRVKSIPLTTGWNLVGYNSLNSMPTTEAMSSVEGNWNSVWSYEGGNWKRYDMTGPDFLNSLTIMEPGKGYWLNMKSPDTWTLGA